MLAPDKPNRNIFLLHPLLTQKLLPALSHSEKTGLHAHVFEAVRTGKRQSWLYAQGRTRDGQIVTGAKAGQSWHEYGLAVDLVFDRSPEQEGIQWSWQGDYDRLGAIVRSYGLEQLTRKVAPDQKAIYYDRPHFQLTYGLTIKEAFLIRQKYGIFGVWQEICDRSTRT